MHKLCLKLFDLKLLAHSVWVWLSVKAITVMQSSWSQHTHNTHAGWMDGCDNKQMSSHQQRTDSTGRGTPARTCSCSTHACCCSSACLSATRACLACRWCCWCWFDFMLMVLLVCQLSCCCCGC